MAGPDFHQTGYGRRFFDSQLPELIKGINRLATALEPQVELREKEAEPWHNNELQFARLLWELQGTLENKTNLYEVAESMDIELAQVEELFKRAEDIFEKAKADIR